MNESTNAVFAEMEAVAQNWDSMTPGDIWPAFDAGISEVARLVVELRDRTRRYDDLRTAYDIVMDRFSHAQDAIRFALDARASGLRCYMDTPCDEPTCVHHKFVAVLQPLTEHPAASK